MTDTRMDETMKRFRNRALRRALVDYEVEISDFTIAVAAGDRAAQEAHPNNLHPYPQGSANVESKPINKRLNKMAALLDLGRQSGGSSAREFTARNSKTALPPEVLNNPNIAVKEAWAVAFASSLAKVGYRVAAISRLD